MKKVILSTFLLLFTLSSFSQDKAQDLYLKAWDNFNKKKYKEAAILFERSIELGKKGNIVYLNAASAWAYVPNKEKVFVNLEKLINAGYVDKGYILEYFTEFNKYEDKPEWKLLISKMDSMREVFLNYAKDVDFQNLTKEQMYQDYDTLVSKLSKYSPHLKIQNRVSGLDPEFKKNRKLIEECGNSQEFVKLIKKTVINCQDGHTSLVSINPFQYLSEGKDTTLCASLYKYQEYFESLVTNGNNLPKLVYYDGSYYLSSEYQFANTTIPIKAELIKVDELEPSAFINRNISTITALAWDFNKQNYYSEYFLQRKITESDSLKLIFKKDERVFTANIKLVLGNRNNEKEELKGTVSYWDEENILYIRIPEMVNGLEYVSDIQSYKNKNIDKVIIDIRNNLGGSDYEWEDILSSITSLKQKIQVDYAFNKAYDKKGESQQFNILPDLNLRYTQDKFSIWNKEIEGIGFKGNIYVLYNDFSYSAAGSLVSACRYFDNLYAVGFKTGRILGFGTSPREFILTNTKIGIRLNPVLDVTNVSKIEDVFHNEPEIKVNFSLDEKIVQRNNRHNFESIRNIDPYIKAVLTHEK